MAEETPLAAPATVIRGVTILDPEAADRPFQADLSIVGKHIGRIIPHGTAPPPPATARVVDGSRWLAVPGLVNAHYHSHDVLLKGSFDVMSLERWTFRALPRYFPPRSDDELRLRTLVGAAECLLGGITTVQDMLSLWPLDRRQIEVVRRAYEDAGLRVVLGMQVADVGALDTMPFLRDILPAEAAALAAGPPPPAGMRDAVAEMADILAAHPARDDDRLGWAVCPSSPERCGPALLTALRDLASEHGRRMFSHVAISRMEAVAARELFKADGGSPIRYLARLGLLGPQLTLAHGVWLDRRDMAMLAKSGTRMVLNPMSNLKTKNGIAPLRRYLDHGVGVALGCDNCSCSDAQNMFQAMKLAVLQAAVTDHDEGPPHAADALRAATLGGARALGLEQDIGRLAEGRKADITFLDLRDPVYLPLNDAARQVVFGESGRGVAAVMVDGRMLVENGRLASIDLETVRRELAGHLPVLERDARVAAARAARLDPYLRLAHERALGVKLGMRRFAELASRG
ncbi:amidohydrolase family protein [Pigmentiphaga sp.]|uniref:amidohydrolase family protein n=1 Tax=Pigmentiphaga sp. TaxID=1977564 RepID=UPI00128B9505|nr:amidohydrolase family protein [Pigmentiphaga sp.]